MKLWSAIFISAIIFGVAALLDGQAPAPAAAQVPAAPTAPTAAAAYPGRYQLMAADAFQNNATVWMIDTQTGDTWRRAGNRWVYEGNPTQDPGTKTPATRPAARPTLPELP